MEANKPEYFVDGFLIRHFGIWPVAVDKDNLFQEQKHFLMYLVGTIPRMEEWARQVNFQKQIQEVESYTEKDLIFSDEELDIIRIQGKNIEEYKKEKLPEEKKNKIKEIKKNFGIEEKEELKGIEGIEGIPEITDTKPGNIQELWKILNGKGLV